MPRTISTATATLSTGVQQHFQHLFFGRFIAPDGSFEDLAITDNTYDLVYGSVTYLAAGGLLSFDTVAEALDQRVSDMTFQLTGLDVTAMQVALNYNLVGDAVSLYRVWLDATGAIAGAVTLFEGKSNGGQIVQTGDTVQITLNASDFFADFNRVAGRRCNPNDMREFFPGDDSMNFVALSQNRVINW